MTQTEMEQLLENIDRRLARVEQKLPTLATKEDFEESKHFARMLNESTRDEIRMVADGVAMLSAQVRDMGAQLIGLTRRLEAKGVI